MSNYKDMLLVGEDYIKTYTNVCDNLAGDYILPAIYFAQHQYLEELIGTSLVRKIQIILSDNTINNEENKAYKELLDDYLQDYLAYEAIVEVILYTSMKINNFGASRTEDEKQYGISYDEVFKLRDEYKHKADYLAYRIQRFLLANYGDYPELQEYKSIEDLQQNMYSAAGCSIFLGGARGKTVAPSKGEGYLKAKYNFPSTNK